MVQGQDLLGDGVNVAARLQSAAEPGGICVSGSVYDQIRNKLSLSFKPLGELNFKHIPQAVRVFSIAEAEGLGLLPSRAGRGLAKRLTIAAALLCIVAGVGLWAYSGYQRSKAELAREARVTTERLAVEEARLPVDAERQAAELAPQKPKAERSQVEEQAHRLVNSEQTKAEDAQKVATARPSTESPQALAVPTAVENARDGLYGGQICYGPSPSDPARCYPAQAILRQGKVSGQWPGRDPGVTMYLAGDVSTSGDVTIHMHGERGDGSRLAVGDLVGTLRDGHLDAAGRFLNGRSISLNWYRN
jgi:hypothetical protein